MFWTDVALYAVRIQFMLHNKVCMSSVPYTCGRAFFFRSASLRGSRVVSSLKGSRVPHSEGLYLRASDSHACSVALCCHVASGSAQDAYDFYVSSAADR